MKKELNFTEICKLIKQSDSTLLDDIDKLLSVSLLFTPLIIGPQGIPVITMIAAKGTIIELGKKVLNKILEKEEFNYKAKVQQMEILYGLICFTSYFDALDDVLGTKLRKKLDKYIRIKPGLIQESMKYSISGNCDSNSYSSKGIDKVQFDQRVSFPHPIVPYDLQMKRLNDLYSNMTSSLERNFLQILTMDIDDDKAKEFITIKDKINIIPKKAMKNFESQYTLLAMKFNDFCVWSRIHEFKTTNGKLKDLSNYLNNIYNISEENTKEIDVGFKKLEETVLSMPGIFKDIENQEIVNRLKLEYNARIDEPIIEVKDQNIDDVKKLNFPKISDVFIPQTYRSILYDNRNIHLEKEETWNGIDSKNNLNSFILSLISSPYSVESPILILGHPGSGKSLLTKVLSAKLFSENIIPIRVILREVDTDATISAQIEEQIYNTTRNRVESWGVFSVQFTNRPLVVILDGFDELLQASGKVHANYLQQVQEFQKNELIQNRPVRVIITSRITLIDKARIPLGTTVIRLNEFNDDQREEWIKIWNEHNNNYFQSRKLKPFSVPNEPKIIELAKQPLLLLMLAIYDSGENNLGKGKNILRTVLYYRLLKRFVIREKEKDPNYEELRADEKEVIIQEDLRRLGVVAIGMYNRRKLFMSMEELNNDLKFYDMKRLETDQDGRTLTQAEFLLGSFFFIHKSKSGNIQDELPPGQEAAFEFLHNTFGEFLTADFILKHSFEEINEITEMKDNLFFKSRLDASLSNPDSLKKGWFTCLMYTPLFSRPEILDMLQEWTWETLKKKKCKREKFIESLNDIVNSQLTAILRSKKLPNIFQSSEADHFVSMPILGHIAIYTINLITLRAILSNKEYIFDEKIFEEDDKKNDYYESRVRAWDKLVSIWKSWFSIDSLVGISSVLVARRDLNRIAVSTHEKYIEISNDNLLDTLFNVSSSLGDNITMGLIGVHSLNLKNPISSLNMLQKRLESENVKMDLCFVNKKIMHVLVEPQIKFNELENYLLTGIDTIYHGGQPSLWVLEFFFLLKWSYDRGLISTKFTIDIIRKKMGDSDVHRLMRQYEDIALEIYKIVKDVQFVGRGNFNLRVLNDIDQRSIRRFRISMDNPDTSLIILERELYRSYYNSFRNTEIDDFQKEILEKRHQYPILSIQYLKLFIRNYREIEPFSNENVIECLLDIKYLNILFEYDLISEEELMRIYYSVFRYENNLTINLSQEKYKNIARDILKILDHHLGIGLRILSILLVFFEDEIINGIKSQSSILVNRYPRRILYAGLVNGIKFIGVFFKLLRMIGYDGFEKYILSELSSISEDYYHEKVNMKCDLQTLIEIIKIINKRNAFTTSSKEIEYIINLLIYNFNNIPLKYLNDITEFSKKHKSTVLNNKFQQINKHVQ